MKKHISFSDYLLKINNMTTLIKLKSKLPKRMKECGCEKSDLGYHLKECTFFPHGWNSYRAKVLKIINNLSKKYEMP